MLFETERKYMLRINLTNLRRPSIVHVQHINAASAPNKIIIHYYSETCQILEFNFTASLITQINCWSSQFVIIRK